VLLSWGLWAVVGGGDVEGGETGSEARLWIVCLRAPSYPGSILATDKPHPRSHVCCCALSTQAVLPKSPNPCCLIKRSLVLLTPSLGHLMHAVPMLCPCCALSPQAVLPVGPGHHMGCPEPPAVPRPGSSSSSTPQRLGA
jgi:hypothetical protein